MFVHVLHHKAHFSLIHHNTTKAAPFGRLQQLLHCSVILELKLNNQESVLFILPKQGEPDNQPAGYTAASGSTPSAPPVGDAE